MARFARCLGTRVLDIERRLLREQECGREDDLLFLGQLAVAFEIDVATSVLQHR
jgi:hypothetical protein